MTDLRNTIAHILEHRQYLANANEATTQQYVVLPILRALGWDDANLASIEILPEYVVENGRVDYALRPRNAQNPVVFIECKRWDTPLSGTHETQIISYAFNSGVPIAVLTNGRMWEFYLPWVEGTTVSERIFCTIDIEEQDVPVSDLEKYLSNANVVSGRARGYAQNTWQTQRRQEEIEEIRTLVPEEQRVYYETELQEGGREFYKSVAKTRNLIQEENWELDMHFTQNYCVFRFQGRHVFNLRSHIRRFSVNITEIEAEQLRNQHGCEIVHWGRMTGRPYYAIPENLSELFPVLEFAYNKHRAG